MTESVVLVDWLGRGGIAHTTQTWYRELRAAGRDVTVVTRADRELVAAVPDSVAVGRRGPLALRHAAVVRAAVRTVERLGRCTVVLQGSVLPQLELRVVRAAQAAGCRVLAVAHEPAVTRFSPGSGWALRRLVLASDVVVAHSCYVRDELSAMSGRGEIEVVPLPLQIDLLDLVGTTGSVLTPGDEPVALHFGHLHRDYKGSATVLRLAARGVNGWRIAFVGKGAPERATGATTVPRFLQAAELVATVEGSASTLLPYARASQSAAVVLAQGLGSVVVASAVGGIREQIRHGMTGWLVDAGAPLEAWIEALEALGDPAERSRIAGEAAQAVRAQHAEFAHRIVSLTS